MDDSELLGRFAHDRSESSFALLARRHAGLVFDIALRITRSRSLAEEIVQNVFVSLARKASHVSKSRVVIAWLHRSAVLESRTVLRSESRRRKYTVEAAAMAAEPGLSPDPRLIELLDSLDEALDSLSSTEREVLLQHYYNRRSYRETGLLIGTSDAAARQLAARARSRLAAWFHRRGTEVRASSLGTLLGGHFPSEHASSNASLAESATRAAVSQTTPSSIIDPDKILHFLPIMKLQAALCLLTGFLLTFAFGLGREPEGREGAVDAPPDHPRSIPVASGRSRPGKGPVNLTEGFDLGWFEKEMASVARLAKDRRLGLRVTTENAMGTTPSFDLSYGPQLQLARLVMYQPVSQMPALLAACQRGDPEAKGQFVIQALFARWAEGDPKTARTHVGELPRKAQEHAIQGMCSTLINLDVEAAARMALSLPLKIREGLYDGSRQGFINNIISVCGSHNPQATLRACLDAPEHLAGEVVDRVMQRWIQEDPDTASKWFAVTGASVEIPGKGRVERQSVKMLQQSHPELAARVVNSLPAGPLRDSLTDELSGTPAVGHDEN